jgi:hypothetical protein
MDEMLKTAAAVQDTVQRVDNALLGATSRWFGPLMRHVVQLSKVALHTLRLFEEQQDKWYCRPAALGGVAGRLDQLMRDAMEVIAQAIQGVPPSPLGALHTPEAKTFWLSRVDPEGAVFELETRRFQEAVVEVRHSTVRGGGKGMVGSVDGGGGVRLVPAVLAFMADRGGGELLLLLLLPLLLLCGHAVLGGCAASNLT